MAATPAMNAKHTGAPKYRARKDYSQAIVTLTDAVTGKRKDFWLGEYGSPESHEMYHRVLAEWEANQRRLPNVGRADKTVIHRLTVSELILNYKPFVEASFKLSSRHTIYMALRVLRQFYGRTSAQDFGPKKLRLVREQMIKGDARSDPPRKAWSRTTVNKAVHQITAMFKWAASHELLPAAVHQQLKTVGALRKGRCEAVEPDPVKPVAIEVVEATKQHLGRQVMALVDLQLLTGARGGELFKLRPIDIDTSDEIGVWAIRPGDHKNAHRGHERVIYLGPKAKAVIQPFLTGRRLDAYLFSPAEAVAEARAARSAKRKTPLSCGNRTGSNRVKAPKCQPRDHYTAASYRRAIERACGKAGTYPWHPHQLRHTAATLIRREFGLETARIVLGHSSALITDAVYAERDTLQVIDAMRKLG